MKAKSAECRTRSPKSDDEIFKEKQRAWNETPESRVLVLNSQQMAKLNSQEFEVVNNIGNRIYGGRGKK